MLSRTLCILVASAVLALPAALDATTTNVTADDPLAPYLSLPPGERYWQLRFLLAVTEGMDPALIEQMDRDSEEAKVVLAKLGPDHGIRPLIQC